MQIALNSYLDRNITNASTWHDVTHLSDLFDLGAALADETAALRGGNDESYGDWWFGQCAVL